MAETSVRNAARHGLPQEQRGWLHDYLHKTDVPALYHRHNSRSRVHSIVWLVVLLVFTALCIFNLYTTVQQIRENYSSVDAIKVVFIRNGSSVFISLQVTNTARDILPSYTMCFVGAPRLLNTDSWRTPAWSIVLPSLVAIIAK